MGDTFSKILEYVATVPEGKVVTYGFVAKELKLKTPRIVGFALHTNKDPIKYPCHRVVKKDGSLAPGYVFGGEIEQQRKLELEGVEFAEGKVDLDECLWRKG